MEGIKEVNHQLKIECPDNFILQSFCQNDRELLIAFTCDGGPREDHAYRVTFFKTAIFHLPSVLYQEILLKRQQPSKSGI